MRSKVGSLRGEVVTAQIAESLRPRRSGAPFWGDMIVAEGKATRRPRCQFQSENPSSEGEGVGGVGIEKDGVHGFFGGSFVKDESS